MSFEKHSNFNKLANFSEVKFGENKPVLEVELNEMQQIQNEARADIIRDTMPSGFVTLGDIDYDYCANNDNQIKLSTESIAYVNGYRITIPANTVIEIGEADKIREDLVFLEVWKEAVNDIDTLTEYGGENNAVINNPIKDERYPIATSQRVALKYRIRHVADLNFNYSYSSATCSTLHPYIGWNGDKNFSPVYAMGGNNSLECPKQILGEEIFRSANKEWRYVAINDSGLWIAGLPETDERCTKERYKSIDGFVYAIPMFRLIRKPHVGLASPFEYKKIHNQLDPKKFAHLVGQENVEKVHSVNIKGKTFKNLLTHAQQQGNGAFNVNVSPDIVTFDTNASWGKLGFLVNGEPNTKYIFHCSDFYKGEKSVEFYVRFSDSIHAPAQTLNKIDSNTYTFTTDSSDVFMFSFEISGGVSGAYVKYPILMKYSEWEEQLRGKAITGVKSLGENTNNSITVENNLLEEGTYVHELQNHILPTHPEVTHVTWGEDVVIPPEVEIELKRGEEVVQTITQLPVKLETTGEEKLHVKTMKGQTLVNICSLSSSLTVEAKTPNSTTINNTSLLKTSTKYLIMFTSDIAARISFQELDTSNNFLYNNWHDARIGRNVVLITTNESTKRIKVFNNSTDSITISDVMILEYQEGMENWGLKYFTGMQSVEAPNIKVTGKNLYTHQKAEVQGINKQDVVVYVPVSPNTTYTFDASAKSWATVTLYNTGGSETRLLGGVQDSKIVTFTTDSSEVLAKLIFYNGNNTDIRDVDFEKLQIQFVEGSVIPSYELGKLNELRTPKGTVLRSLSPSIFDYIDFNMGVLNRKIGEKVLDSSISPYGLTQQTNGACFHVNISSYNFTTDSTNRNLTMSDRFVTKSWSGNHQPYTMFFGSGHDLYFVLPSSVTTIEQVKEWFRNNPTTLNYVLTTQLNEKIGLSEDDYVGKSKVTYQLAEPLRKVGTYSDFIKGKTLYSNIGVEVFDGSEEWARQSGTDYGFYVDHPNSMPSTPLISPQLPTINGWENYARKGIFRGAGAIGLVVSADDLSENTLQGFKNWLQANPVTIYYVKANPVEIPLKEVSPLDVDFSYYRQFKRGYENYLKELPNGVKDVVENGKVKRNVGLVSLGDFELDKWRIEFSNEKYIAFDLLGFGSTIENPYTSDYRFSNVLPYITHDQYLQADTEGLRSSSIPALVISKSRLTTPDTTGLVKWLKSNNVSMMYQLKEPTTEALTEENKRYVPYMPLNSYVGSLYVADGINQTKFLTDFSPSEYEVQTYHRYFSNEFNMFEDIKRKKSPYGHKTVPVSLTANLHDGELYTNTGFVLNDGSYETATDWVASKNLISVVSGKTYHIKLEANDTDITSNRRYVYVYKYDVDGKYLKSRLDLGVTSQFTSDFTGQVLIVIRTKNVSHIQVTEDKAYAENIPYILGEKFIAGLEKHEIEDLRHKVSLTGFDYSQLLQDSFLKLIKGELS